MGSETLAFAPIHLGKLGIFTLNWGTIIKMTWLSPNITGVGGFTVVVSASSPAGTSSEGKVSGGAFCGGGFGNNDPAI